MKVQQQWLHNDREYRLVSRDTDPGPVPGLRMNHLVLQVRSPTESETWLDLEKEVLPDPTDAQQTLPWLYAKEGLSRRCKDKLGMPETCFQL